MKCKHILETTEVVDVTSEEDDPYHDWEVDPYYKFVDELVKAGFSHDEIYFLDFNKEEGIIVDYDLYPHEILWWDDKLKKMKLRMKYPPIQKYRKALKDLGIKYDKDYWENTYENNQ